MVNDILSVRCTKTIFKVDGLYLFPRKRIKFEKAIIWVKLSYQLQSIDLRKEYWFQITSSHAFKA